MKPKVSIILTSWNRPDALMESIKSVINQTFKEWQLIVVDNTKNPITRDLIKQQVTSISKKDSRILFMQLPSINPEEKCPYGVSINVASGYIKGDYITYLCDDDIYHKGHLETMLGVFNKTEEAEVVYTGLFVHKDGVEDYTLDALIIRKCGFCSVDHITVMHKKSVMDVVGPWSEDKTHNRFGDAEYWMRLSRAGFLMYPTKEITCIKVVGEDSMNLFGGTSK